MKHIVRQLEVPGIYKRSLCTIGEELDRLVDFCDVPEKVREEAKDFRVHFHFEIENLGNNRRAGYAKQMIERYDRKVLELYSLF
jgi:hypothetical protein